MYFMFLYFIIYSFIGWAIESVYVSAKTHRLINRGFLNGPVCPIYGVGAIIILTALTPFKDNILLIFTVGLVLTSILEYATGYILEKIFHAKWWDYSSHRFNIHGRVSLLNSFYWGVLSVILLEVIHPRILLIIASIPLKACIILTYIILIIMIADLAVTIPTIITLNIRLRTLHKIYNDLQDKLNISPIIQDKIQELHKKYNEVISKKNILHKRLIFAFPTLKSIKFDRALTQLKNKIKFSNKKKEL